MTDTDKPPQKAVTAAVQRRRDKLLVAVRRHVSRKAHERAEERLRRHLARDPDHVEALYALAALSIVRMDLAEAYSLLQRVLELAPMSREPADLQGVVLGLAGQLNPAVFHAKLAVSLTPDPRFEGLAPPTLPSFAAVLQFIAEEPLLKRALQALSRGNHRQAETWCRQHLAFEPGSAPAWIALATTLRAEGRHRAALDALRAARHAVPDNVDLQSLLAQTLAAVGDHAASGTAHRLAVSRAPNDVQAAAAALVDGWSRPHAAPASTLAAIRDWSERFGSGGRVIRTKRARLTGPDRRLTLGVVFGSTWRQDWIPFLGQVLAAARRDRFAVFGFGDGALDRGPNLPLQSAVHHWRDIAEMDAATLNAVIAAEGIDILLHVGGFNAPASLAVLGTRAAPCQLVWSGCPFGTGLAEVDFLLTDRFVCPKPEQVATPPLFLELGSVLTAPPMTGPARPVRDPAAPVVFAADAELAAIEPEAVAAWAAVLDYVPGSTLVLRDHDFTEPTNLARLTDLFGNHGLSHRIDVADADRHTLFADADVVLMPMGRADPQGVVDALAAGCPPVCPIGDGPFARRAAAVLHHLGFGAETIAVDSEDYVAKALSWTTLITGDGGSPWRADVARSLATAAVFDPKARADDLAAALESAWSQTGRAGADNAGCVA